MVAVIADRLIEGEGTREADWLAWAGLADAPELPLDAWLRAAQRLVIVAPHPDDEILAAGALAHLHAGRGGEVMVVAVTDGEASHRGDPAWTAERLAAARREESAAGLRRLLPEPPEMLRLVLPDSAVASEAARLRDALVGALRPSDVVVTTWRFDGHPDHEAAGAAAAQATETAGCRLVEAPVWMWHWATPGDPRVPWERLRSLAVPASTREHRAEALAAHASQLEPRGNGEGPVLTPAILKRLARARDSFFI